MAKFSITFSFRRKKDSTMESGHSQIVYKTKATMEGLLPTRKPGFHQAVALVCHDQSC